MRVQRRGELLLELLSEEIPAGMQRRAIARACRAVARQARRRRDPGGRNARVCHAAAPHGHCAREFPQRNRSLRGAARAARRRAGGGNRGLSALAPGIASIEECEMPRHRSGRVLFRRRSSAPAGRRPTVLPELVRSAIFELPWPKSMRYPGLVAALGAAADLGRLPVRGRGASLAARPGSGWTDDQRTSFSVAGRDLVANAAEYLERLGKAHVVLDHGAAAKK